MGNEGVGFGVVCEGEFRVGGILACMSVACVPCAQGLACFGGELECEAWGRVWGGCLYVPLPLLWPDAVPQMLTCKHPFHPPHKELPGVCSNRKAGPGMGQTSGKVSCLLVPVKRAGVTNSACCVPPAAHPLYPSFFPSELLP